MKSQKGNYSIMPHYGADALRSTHHSVLFRVLFRRVSSGKKIMGMGYQIDNPGLGLGAFSNTFLPTYFWCHPFWRSFFKLVLGWGEEKIIDHTTHITIYCFVLCSFARENWYLG